VWFFFFVVVYKNFPNVNLGHLWFRFVGKLYLSTHVQCSFYQLLKASYATEIFKMHLILTLFLYCGCFELVNNQNLIRSAVLKLQILQGFPRADIDIPTVRADRHRLAGTMLYPSFSALFNCKPLLVALDACSGA